MAIHLRPSGISIEAPDDARVIDLESPPAAEAVRRAPPPPASGRRLPTGPVTLAAGTPAAPGGDPLVDSLRAQDLELVDAFALDLPVRTATTRGAGAVPPALRLELSEEEEAVVLLETEGLYEWRFSDASRTEPVAPARRGPVVEPERRRAVYDLEPGGEGAAETRSRGMADLVLPRIRAYVLKFVAGRIARHSVKFLERNARPGLVLMDAGDPAAWRRLEDLGAVDLPPDRPARILLFVHGTFSSTRGSFGGLAATAWGRDFLAAAAGSYDLVLGYDHRTLSEDPLENAADLLARLERGRFQGPPSIDAISFSRGSLVLRSLIEYLLPASSLEARVRHAVFIGGTNGGTLLAEPDNWSRLADLYTNLAAAGSRVIDILGSPVAGQVLRESVATIGAFVKHLAVAAVHDRRIPGLAAMEPDGPFVTELNTTQPGQPGAAESIYCVVSSEFDVRAGEGAPELSRRVRQWIVDNFADRLLGEPNDLVVHTRAMSAIDEGAGAFVKDTLAFGRNPHVYHTIYFTRPEVAQALTRWLGLERQAAAAPVVRRAAGVPALADVAIIPASSEEPLEGIIGAADRAGARYVVIDRPGHGKYALARDELISARGMLTGPELKDPGFPVWMALDRTPGLELRESAVSRMLPVGSAPEAIAEPPDRQGLTARRTVLVDRDVPVAVVEPPEALAPIERLAAVNRGLETARRRGAPRSPLPAAPAPGGARGGGAPGAVGAGAPSAPGGAPPPDQDASAAAPAAVERSPGTAPFYFSANVPEEVAVGATALVRVTVSREQIEALAGLSGDAGAVLDLERKLTVRLVCIRGFVARGETIATVDPAARQTFRFVFDVEASEAGEGELLVMFLQGAEEVANITLEPKVTVGASATPVRTLTRGVEASAPGGGVFPVLWIIEKEQNGRPVNHFSLNLGDGEYVSAESEPLRTGRGTYIAGLYKEIESRWLSSGNDFDAFEQEMRAYGGLLFDELVPRVIQSALWEERDALASIQVVSEEPFTPWEIVHLKPPAPSGGRSPLPPETHFLAQKGLIRWIHNVDRAPREIRVRPGRARHVVPEYPGEYRLPEAEQEIPFLLEKLGTEPAEPEVNALRTLLADGGAIDLFHFSGHGEAVAQSESDRSTRSHLMLQGRFEGGRWLPIYLSAEVVAQHARLASDDGNRPLVVLNACQIGRANWQLTSIGGFADAFVRGGAGAFVGTLWMVGDAPARNFTEGFYCALLEGQPLARAAVAGRDAARRARDATWLAYVVYGHPAAALRVEPRQSTGRPPTLTIPDPV